MISPEVIECNPAIACSNVDFPHPDGPSRTRNSPESTLTLMSASTVFREYDFVIFCKESVVIAQPLTEPAMRPRRKYLPATM